MAKNAIENVKCCLDELNKAKTKLNEAVSSAEKQQNKNLIKNSINSVDQCIDCVQNTINNYTEGNK